MTYRARKIRQARGLPLDPLPIRCAQEVEARHGYETFEYGVCGSFDPRPGYEQDRSKYE